MYIEAIWLFILGCISYTRCYESFDRRYIAKKLVFAAFDLPLGLIWKGGGSSISSVNMVQTVPIVPRAVVPSSEG